MKMIGIRMGLPIVFPRNSQRKIWKNSLCHVSFIAMEIDMMTLTLRASNCRSVLERCAGSVCLWWSCLRWSWKRNGVRKHARRPRGCPSATMLWVCGAPSVGRVTTVASNQQLGKGHLAEHIPIPQAHASGGSSEAGTTFSTSSRRTSIRLESL